MFPPTLSALKEGTTLVGSSARSRTSPMNPVPFNLIDSTLREVKGRVSNLLRTVQLSDFNETIRAELSYSELVTSSEGRQDSTETRIGTDFDHSSMANTFPSFPYRIFDHKVGNEKSAARQRQETWITMRRSPISR